MATVTLNVGKKNGLKTIGDFNEFTIKGIFNDWTQNPNHYVTEIPIELFKGNTNDYFKLFLVNYCTKSLGRDVLEIHVAKVYKPSQENFKHNYKVVKPKVEFSLEPKNPKAQVQVHILVYDIDKRCPSDKFIHICEKITTEGVPFLKDMDCPENLNIMDNGVPTQPETKKGNILQGG